MYYIIINIARASENIAILSLEVLEQGRKFTNLHIGTCLNRQIYFLHRCYLCALHIVTVSFISVEAMQVNILIAATAYV